MKKNFKQLDKELIKHFFVNEKLSGYQIAKKFKVSVVKILNMLKEQEVDTSYRGAKLYNKEKIKRELGALADYFTEKRKQYSDLQSIEDKKKFRKEFVSEIRNKGIFPLKVLAKRHSLSIQSIRKIPEYRNMLDTYEYIIKK